MIQEQLNQFAKEVYQNAAAHGFHDDDQDRSLVENYAVWTANLHGETSELWEAARKGKAQEMCDKTMYMEDHFGESLTNEEEELADIIIRALDTAEARKINIGRAVWIKHEFNKTRSFRHGGKLA